MQSSWEESDALQISGRQLTGAGVGGDATVWIVTKNRDKTMSVGTWLNGGAEAGGAEARRQEMGA